MLCELHFSFKPSLLYLSWVLYSFPPTLGSYLSCRYIAFSIILNILKNPLPWTTCPQDTGSHSLLISSPQSLRECFAPPGRCAACSSPQRGLVLIALYCWLSWHQLGLNTVHALCGSPSRLLAHPPCLTQPCPQKATWPSYWAVAAGQDQAQCWHQYGKEVQKLFVCPPFLMSIVCEELVLWQRVREADWDRRGMEWEVVFTAAWIPYKVNISHDSVYNLVVCTFWPPVWF